VIKLRQHVDALKAERDAAKQEAVSARQDAVTRAEADRKRIDGLMIQVQDMRAEIERLKKPRQHPVKPGERLRKTTDGLMYKAGECFRLTGYEMINGEIWCNLENGASWLMSVCEPCDPPTEATHDTPAGKQAAESVKVTT
jgi:outer membrane murein-binding lipoprotein Lpp